MVCMCHPEYKRSLEVSGPRDTPDKSCTTHVAYNMLDPVSVTFLRCGDLCWPCCGTGNQLLLLKQGVGQPQMTAEEVSFRPQIP